MPAASLSASAALHGADDPGQRRKDTHDGTTGFVDILPLWEEAVIARRVVISQVVDADLSVKADGGP